jgi:hypothetical protein
MKNITDLINTNGIQDQQFNQQQENISPELREAINYCWREMKMAKKSWSKELKTEEDIKRYLRGLSKALIAGRIDSMEKLKYGLEAMYLDESDWLPSVGMFVKWCKEGYNQHLHQQELLNNTKRITEESRLLASEPWEVRKARGKAEIAKMKAMLKNK